MALSSAEVSMENSSHHNQSVWRSLLSVMAVILLFVMCLIGLLITCYGLLFIHWPPFGPIIMGFGIALPCIWDLAAQSGLAALIFGRPKS